MRYHAVLDQIVNADLFEQSKWGDETWSRLYEEVDEDVLLRSSEKLRELDLFQDIGKTAIRPTKSLSRVTEKHTASLNSPYKNYFKDVCDFMAVRIFCDVCDIKDKIKLISERLEDYPGSKLLIRRSGNLEQQQQPYGSHQIEDLYTDITQYVYVYLPSIGIIEAQIGHPFAAHTFTIDSAIRDAKNHGAPCDLVDLWKDDFYDDVKAYILSQANNQDSEKSWVDLMQKALLIHDGRIPDDLKKILKDLAPPKPLLGVASDVVVAPNEVEQQFHCC